MTYRIVLFEGERLLTEHKIADAKTDAWLLLAWVCKIDKNFYYMHMNEEMPKEQQSMYEEALKRRMTHIPLQYITGEQEFMGLRFLVNPNVLIPRQDTEILVEEALKRIKPGMDVLDLCTGSGCILISILKNISQIHGTASDISKEALLTAKENAGLHKVSIDFIESDLFLHIGGKYDVIVSNPPYIKTEEIENLMPEVRDFEPKTALDGSFDGLLFYRNIIAKGREHLKPDGWLLFEIGYDQGEAVSNLMREAGYSGVLTVKDLAGLDRVVIGEKK